MSRAQTTLDLIVETLKTRSGERLTANKLSGLMVSENEAWASKKRKNSQNEQIRNGGFEELRAQVQSEIGSHKERIENASQSSYDRRPSSEILPYHTYGKRRSRSDRD